MFMNITRSEIAIAENAMEILSNFFVMRDEWDLMSNDEIEARWDSYGSWWEDVKEMVLRAAEEFEKEYADLDDYIGNIAEFSEKELKKAFGRKKYYVVSIVETYEKVVTVAADNEEEAKGIVDREYSKGNLRDSMFCSYDVFGGGEANEEDKRMYDRIEEE